MSLVAHVLLEVYRSNILARPTLHIVDKPDLLSGPYLLL